MGTARSQNAKENGQTINGIDKNLHIDLGCQLHQSKASLQRRSASGHDIRVNRIAHAQRSQKVKNVNEQALRYAKQLPSHHSRCL